MKKDINLVLLESLSKEFTISKISYLVYIEFAHIENRSEKTKTVLKSLGLQGKLLVWDKEVVTNVKHTENMGSFSKHISMSKKLFSYTFKKKKEQG